MRPWLPDVFAAWLLCVSGIVLAADGVPVPANLVPPDQAEFFESKIRPVLSQNCERCHGAKKQESGLRLDSREGFAKGADAGPVVEPGKPEESPLIEAVSHQGLVKMPPDAKLSPAAIADITTWVRMGAPWPENHGLDAAQPTVGTTARPAPRDHWSFRPIRRPELPDVRDPSRVQTPVDRFIQASLDAKGLAPSPRADKRTLIRRASFDLTGLPPTPEEVAAFEADASSDAYARLVDRLLASPHYGERWGRHWLDVARYSDTKGYVFTAERRYPFSYTYRDYVVGAFNRDLRFDRFIVEQLAADRLIQGDDRRTLTALGFLTLADVRRQGDLAVSLEKFQRPGGAVGERPDLPPSLLASGFEDEPQAMADADDLPGTRMAARFRQDLPGAVAVVVEEEALPSASRRLAMADQPGRNHLGVVPDQDVTAGEQFGEVAKAMVRDPPAGSVHDHEPRLFPTIRRPLGDQPLGKLEVELGGQQRPAFPF